MTPISVATLLALAGAAFAAGRLSGTAATGVWLGALLGAAIAIVGVLWVRHALIWRPLRAFRAQTEAFLAKIAVLFMAAIAFRFVAPLSAVADWMSFVVAYAGVALCVVFGGIVAVLQLKRARATGAQTA